MEIYASENQIMMRCKVKDLMLHLNELSKDYQTLRELIIAHLH